MDERTSALTPTLSAEERENHNTIWKNCAIIVAIPVAGTPLLKHIQHQACFATVVQRQMFPPSPCGREPGEGERSIIFALESPIITGSFEC